MGGGAFPCHRENFRGRGGKAEPEGSKTARRPRANLFAGKDRRGAFDARSAADLPPRFRVFRVRGPGGVPQLKNSVSLCLCVRQNYCHRPELWLWDAKLRNGNAPAPKASGWLSAQCTCREAIRVPEERSEEPAKQGRQRKRANREAAARFFPTTGRPRRNRRMDISTPPCHCLSQHSITGISTAGLTTGSSMPPMTPNCSPSAASASGGLARNLISEPSCRNCAYSTLSMKATGR